MRYYRPAQTTARPSSPEHHLHEELRELLLPTVHCSGGSPFLPHAVCRESEHHRVSKQELLGGQVGSKKKKCKESPLSTKGKKFCMEIQRYLYMTSRKKKSITATTAKQVIS